MTGSSIFDYIHHQDHAEVAEQLGLSLTNNQNLASPSSRASDEGASNQGTNNPDGKWDIGFALTFHNCNDFMEYVELIVDSFQ